MSKLSQILGFIFLAAGLVLAVLLAIMPGSMQVLGLSYEVAATLMAGGAICIGLSAIHDALHFDHGHAHDHGEIEDARRMPPPAPERPRPPERAAKSDASLAERVATAGGAAIVTEKVRETIATVETRPSVADTIEALEQAKNDIASALTVEKPATPEKPSIAAILDKPFGERPAKPAEAPPVVLQMPAPPVVTPPAPPPVAEEAGEAEEADDPDLYVVEEKVIRGRPARVLSDGTVEAETDEGWMRFENLDHLDEYLDAMTPGS